VRCWARPGNAAAGEVTASARGAFQGRPGRGRLSARELHKEAPMFRTIMFPLCLLASCDSTADGAGSGAGLVPLAMAQPSVATPTTTVVSTARATAPVVGAVAMTSPLADASDLQLATALALDGGYLYFTGGGTTDAPPDAPPGSDTYGVLRRVPTGGGPVEELWKGQGVGYGVARHANGMSIATYDYATRGRTGLIRLLRSDGSTDDLSSWRAQGSCVGMTARDGVLFWTNSAGSGGSVNRIDGSGVASSNADAQPCAGKPRARGDRLFWLAGRQLMQTATSNLASAPVWTARNTVEAIAADEQAAEVVVVDDDDLVAVDPSTRQVRVVGSGFRGASDLAFDPRGGHVYVTNAADGTVSAVALADGRRVAIATAQAQPRAIVASADAIYWINGGSRTIMSARP
jgi:hypothetical protein